MFEHISTPHVTFEGMKEGTAQYTCRLCNTHFTSTAPVHKHCNTTPAHATALDERLAAAGFMEDAEPGAGYTNQD